MLKDKLLAYKFDIAEATVAIDNFEGTLCEFFDVNDGAFTPTDVLTIIGNLFAEGFARIDGGNGNYSVLKLVWVEPIAARGVELPYLAA